VVGAKKVGDLRLSWRIVGGYQGILLADLAFQPPAAAGLAFLMTPHIVADINAFILFDALIADITVVFFELVKEGFLKIFLL
jgi:hypothetical protein